MGRLGLHLTWAGLLVGLAIQPRLAAQTNDLPHFQEVLRLLRVNLPGATEEDLNRAAVQGLLDGFRPRVLLVTNTESAATNALTVSSPTVHDGSFAYLRLGGICPALPADFDAAWDTLCATNHFKGLVLDLRYARGEDYRAAAALADRFVAKEQPLIAWGDEVAHSTGRTNAIQLPLVVLINRGTAGAAEALAETLRQTSAALLVGGPTAGEAHVFKEFDLGNGRRLRIASRPVQVGDNQPLDAGVTPDITVGVNPEDEQAWFQDPFKLISRSGGTPESVESTNRARSRINEAELVRRQRERQTPRGEGPATAAAATAPATGIQDPALARALEVLRAIALVGRPRS